MKKYIIFSMIIGLLFSACNPNNDIYDAIQEAEKPYNEKFDIKLIDADYTAIKKLALSKATTKEDSTIANDLATFKSFSSRRSPADLIPDFIATNYIALDSASSINVQYNFAINDYDSIHVEDINYVDIFGSADTCFSNSFKPATYLLTVDTTTNYINYFSCKYGNTFANAVDTVFVFTYLDGEWVTPNNSYIFSSEDYNNIGITESYLNFSATMKPEHYIPNYFKNKYPYAYEKDEIIVIYKYFDGSKTYPIADGYRFNGTEWQNSQEKVSQFIHTGEKWIFDPTINYTIQKEEYQLIVDYVANHEVLSAYMDQTYDNTEYYYGASSHYGNFDMRTYKRIANDSLNYLVDMSDDEVKVEIFNRLKEAIVIFAEARFPTQEPIANGTQVFYEISYKTYEPGNHYYKMKIKCTDVGKFEYFSGPIEY